MNRDKRLRTPPAPFASIPARLLAGAAFALDPAALTMLLLLEAAYHPTRHGMPGAVVPHAIAAKIARVSSKTVVAGFRRLQKEGVIAVGRAGTHPRGQGGANPTATIWRLPHREGGQGVPHLPLAHGMEAPAGSVRLAAGLIRHDVAALSGRELAVLMALAASRHRTSRGEMMDSSPLNVGAAHAAWLTGLPRSSAAIAVQGLLNTGRLILAQKSEGRRAATARLASAYLRHDRRPEAAAEEGMVTSWSFLAGRKTAEKHCPPLSLLDTTDVASSRESGGTP